MIQRPNLQLRDSNKKATILQKTGGQSAGGQILYQKPKLNEGIREKRSVSFHKMTVASLHTKLLWKTIFSYLDLFDWIISVCAPLPSTLCSPQLQSTCHYIVNHYVRLWQVRLGGANNMHPLGAGVGGGHKRKRSI